MSPGLYGPVDAEISMKDLNGECGTGFRVYIVRFVLTSHNADPGWTFRPRGFLSEDLTDFSPDLKREQAIPTDLPKDHQIRCILRIVGR